MMNIGEQDIFLRFSTLITKKVYPPMSGIDGPVKSCFDCFRDYMGDCYFETAELTCDLYFI